MARFCARVIAHGRQASARPRHPKRIPRLPATVQTATAGQPAWAPAVSCQQLKPLALLAQDATLSTLNILVILSIPSILSQLMGLGRTGAGGESAARAVGEEDGGQGLASASRPQPGGSHVAGQQLREGPVS